MTSGYGGYKGLDDAMTELFTWDLDGAVEDGWLLILEMDIDIFIPTSPLFEWNDQSIHDASTRFYLFLKLKESEIEIRVSTKEV